MRRGLKQAVADALTQIGAELRQVREHGATHTDRVWVRLLSTHRSNLIQRLRAHARYPSAENERRLLETLDSWDNLYQEVRKDE